MTTSRLWELIAVLLLTACSAPAPALDSDDGTTGSGGETGDDPATPDLPEGPQDCDIFE